MELFLIVIIFILLLALAAVSVCLCCYQKQTGHLLKELHMAERSETNMLFTSAVPVGETEEMIAALNRIMEHYRQDRARLLRENRSYRESITGISHDIRTPLTSAKGYIQMLCSDAVSEAKKQEYALIVERRLDDLSGMLDQLFLYTRLEAGEFSFVIEVINAGNLFAETVSLFYTAFMEKGCEPEISVSSKPCRIRADRQAFVRIIENLIKNALVHGTGGYQLFLRKEGRQVVIRVSNETVSIRDEDMAHIFDRFYTTDLSRSRKLTGLGLAIVRELTVQMDGKVRAWLKGNVFFIEICFPGAADS